nr:hypothetical protein [Tanacetum cinerariifolium]
MNMGQDKQMQMIGGNGGNQFRQYAGENTGNLNGYNTVQNVGNQNGLIGVQGNGNQNQIGNGNLVAVRVEGNIAGHNGNQIRCYNCRGTDSTPVYNSDGSAEVTDVEQEGETVEQNSANFEETRTLYESLYQNLAVEV